MSKFDAPITEYMTAAPHAVTTDETLSTARRRMRELHFRHLAVYDSGHLVGILSEHDLDVVGGFSEVDPHVAKVRSAMTRDPICVAPTTTLGEAASTMAQRKIGSVLVVDAQQKLLGIFTATDALKFLAYS